MQHHHGIGKALSKRQQPLWKRPFSKSLCIQSNILPTLLCFLFCLVITNWLAHAGCAWVNRAVGTCHVCSGGKRSLKRWGIRWFVVIDSYLETGLMELSKLYGNSLFPYHCRCTLLRCTAHAPHTLFSSIRSIMETQIFIRTLVVRCNMRTQCQVSDQMLPTELF